MKTKTIINCSILSSLILGGCNTIQKSGSVHQKPNIIFILADDMSYYDLSGLGQKHFDTPNLDKLMQEGMFFSEAYAGAPECAPSRGSLLTGMNMGH